MKDAIPSVITEGDSEILSVYFCDLIDFVKSNAVLPPSFFHL